MKFEITKETHNHVMGRVELDGLLSGVKSTPTRKEVLATVAGAKSVSPDVVSVVKISQSFGKRGVTVRAWVYPNVDAAKKSRAYLSVRGTKSDKKAPAK